MTWPYWIRAYKHHCLFIAALEPRSKLTVDDCNGLPKEGDEHIY